MSYDTIKFLNLEDFPIDISSFHVSKSRNILTAYFKLINNTTNCIHCEGKEIVIKDYRMKKVKHSISNASSCFLGYKARRFFCRKCLKTFCESNPFSIKGESISLYTKLAVLEDLKDFSLTFTAIASKYHLSVAHVLNIFDSYVKVSRRKIDSVVCFDEIYTSKLSRAQICFCDF